MSQRQPTKKRATLKPQHRTLLPAQPRALQQQYDQHYHKNGHIHPAHTSFYDLPAELRIEIYRLALSTVKIHILPPNSANHSPHPLVLTTKQVRNEVLPLIHNSCPIHATITDFNFDGLLAWMSRMPPDQESNLCKNSNLCVELCTTSNVAQDATKGHAQKPGTCPSMKNSGILKKWLHLRADIYRPQPSWRYVGAKPDYKTMVEMRRRAKRAAKPGEKKELVIMLKAIGVEIPGEPE